MFILRVLFCMLHVYFIETSQLSENLNSFPAPVFNFCFNSPVDATAHHSVHDLLKEKHREGKLVEFYSCLPDVEFYRCLPDVEIPKLNKFAACNGISVWNNFCL
jgi:hypothetical protein